MQISEEEQEEDFVQLREEFSDKLADLLVGVPVSVTGPILTAALATLIAYNADNLELCEEIQESLNKVVDRYCDLGQRH